MISLLKCGTIPGQMLARKVLRVSVTTLFVMFGCALATGFVFGQDRVPAEDRTAATKLIQALRVGDKITVARFIRYPLARLQPLPPIRSEDEFVRNYAHFFDSGTIRQIEAGEKEIWNSWRGTSIGSGLVWIEEGRIFALNVATTAQKSAAQAAKNRIAATLHPSARNYDTVFFVCRTKNYQVRIHDDGGKVRYFSWKASQPLSGKPDLALIGEMRFLGNGGNTTYTFKNGDYRYDVNQVVLCAENCDSTLVVTKGDETLVVESCLPEN